MGRSNSFCAAIAAWLDTSTEVVMVLVRTGLNGTGCYVLRAANAGLGIERISCGIDLVNKIT